MNREISVNSVPINIEPWLTSVELYPAKNLQAGHGSLWDKTSVLTGCIAPNIQTSLWNRSTDVVKNRYTASMTVVNVL